VVAQRVSGDNMPGMIGRAGKTPKQAQANLKLPSAPKQEMNPGQRFILLVPPLVGGLGQF